MTSLQAAVACRLSQPEFAAKFEVAIQFTKHLAPVHSFHFKFNDLMHVSSKNRLLIEMLIIFVECKCYQLHAENMKGINISSVHLPF